MKHNNELVRKIQLKELEILKVFQDICKRHGLRYFAIGGTCLGAVRHKGFIPWDDDVDVAMPYEDYAKFLELANSELPENYGILDPINSRHCAFFSYFKIHDIKTAFIENAALKYEDRYAGIFIDVFPVHGLPENERERKQILFCSSVIKKFNHKLRFNFNDVSSFNGFILWVLCSPLKLFLPFNYFALKHPNMMSRYTFGCSDKILFPWRGNKPNSEGWYKNIFCYEDFKDTLELPFEDTTISVPSGYDRYLTMDFGDYMTLPPEEKRINHAEFSGGGIVDFERSYKYYAALKRAGKPLC